MILFELGNFVNKKWIFQKINFVRSFLTKGRKSRSIKAAFGQYGNYRCWKCCDKRYSGQLCCGWKSMPCDSKDKWGMLNMNYNDFLTRQQQIKKLSIAEQKNFMNSYWIRNTTKPKCAYLQVFIMGSYFIRKEISEKP